jgi:hypothetical protein
VTEGDSDSLTAEDIIMNLWLINYFLYASQMEKTILFRLVGPLKKFICAPSVAVALAVFWINTGNDKLVTLSIRCRREYKYEF